MPTPVMPHIHQHPRFLRGGRVLTLYPIQHKGRSALQNTSTLRLARCKVPHKAHKSEMMLYLQDMLYAGHADMQGARQAVEA